MTITAIVTGASGGVGYAVCELLARENYNIVGLSRTGKNIMNLAKRKENVEHYCVDLISYKDTEIIFREIEKKHNEIGLIINCSAVFEKKPFIKQDIKKINMMFDTNIKTYINPTKLVLENMLKTNIMGRIINIASVAGKYGIENQAVYSSTKHAIAGFSEALAKELYNTGIKITTLYPGGINTKLWNSRNPYDGDIKNLISPNQVAEIVLYVTKLPHNIVMKEMTFFPTNEIH
jgi:short-subunit dehydrogenase